MQYGKYYVDSMPVPDTEGDWYNVIYDKNPNEHSDAAEIGNFVVPGSAVNAAGDIDAAVEKIMASLFPSNNGTVIGECIEAEGRSYFLKGSTDNGLVYKDYDAFENHPDKVCYVPEYADEVKIGEHYATVADPESCYTKSMLLELCGGNERLCRCLFDSLDWTYPETLLDEWDNFGILDGSDDDE